MRGSDRYYDTAELPWKNPAWERDLEDNRVLSVKGETREMVAHARQLMLEGNNTSIDAPFWVNTNWGISDIYTLLVMMLFLVPLVLILWIPLFLCLFPAVLLNRFYIGWIIPDGPYDALPRDNCFWKFHCLIQFLLCFPALILAAGILMYSNAVMTACGMFYLVVSSLCRLRPCTARLFENLRVVGAYQGGPFLLWHFEDCVAAIAGSVYRQHFFEFMFGFTNMFFINPWWKYWVTGNIFLEDLGERFITQIGNAMDDMNIHDIDTQAIKAISRAKNTPTNRKEIDLKTFAPHYPYPPPGRRYAVGMQHGATVTTFVHTTHFRSPPVGNEGPIASLSNSVALPIYRVMLWRNNPYHIYTGYVEANLSTGLPSQPEKNLGGEHPMWLVNSHNKLAADRNVSWSLGNIDNFFDDFIPQFSHFIRLNVRGREVADAYLRNDSRLGYEQQGRQDTQHMAEF